MKKIYYILIGMVLLAFCNTGTPSYQQGTRILFDGYHAEWTPDLHFSRFIAILDREGYSTNFSDEKIDSYLLSSYSVLVLFAPSKEFEDYEIEAIKNFVRNGGSLLIFGEAGWIMKSEGILTPINSVSTVFGIEFNADTVTDSDTKNQIPETETTMRDADRFVIITNFDRHPVTYNIFTVGYAEGCSLDIVSPAVRLAFGNPTTEAGDRTGKDVIVMAAAEYGSGKVLAVGDKDFLVGGKNRFGAHDGFLVYKDNERLGLSIFEWAAETGISGEDSDSDGVPDTVDRCYNPNCTRVDSQGCPKDTDSDGVNDCDDRCLREAGSSTNNGCPVGTSGAGADTDSDGVNDDEDQCNNPDCSIVDSQGCPKDSDSDGLIDCNDQCPTQYGTQVDGCPKPDADGDGVPDDEDQCYNPECLIVDSQGCPKDTDSDGVNDCTDNCVNQSGPIGNNGCPQGPQICTGTVLILILVVFGVLELKKK
ncbi:MAG: hypothetical protein PVF58_08600 [Candidatus Methanofastidiosia archaeon]|jgi:hypothetical protein